MQNEHLWDRSRISAFTVLSWLLVGCVLILIATLFLRRWDPRCGALAILPEEDASIPLPPNCTQSTEAPVDDMVKYLEEERQQRGLIFKKWIICKPLSAAINFEDDKHWLASYRPLAYQFRRTVVILPYSQPIPKGSPVVAEICLMPRQKYFSQIAGQCGGKFAIWK